MTELKRKQAEQLIKKARKNRKKATNLLMCGAILSTTVLPLTTVFASTLMDKQTTEQTETSTPTIEPLVEENQVEIAKKPILEETPEVSDTTENLSDINQEGDQETTVVETNNETEPQVDSTLPNEETQSETHDKTITTITPEVQQALEQLQQLVEQAKPFVDRESYQSMYVKILETELSSAENMIPYIQEFPSDEDFNNIQYQITRLANALTDVQNHPKTPGELEDSPGVDVYFCTPGEGIGNAIQSPIHLEGRLGETWSFDFPDSFTDENGKTWYNTYMLGENSNGQVTGTFLDEISYAVNWYTDTRPVDNENRTTLENTIESAKPFLDKEKYQEKYVDILAHAIEKAEQDLQDNPLTRGTKTGIFQANIDAINKAVADVKANPVDNGGTTDPQEQSGGVNINFWYALNSEMIQEPIHLDGKVGESYVYDIAKIPATIDYKGRTFYLDIDYLTSISNQFEGTFAKEVKEINVVYSPKALPETQESSLEVLFLDQNGDPIKESVLLEGVKGDKYDITKFATDITGYTLDKTKLPTLTGTLDGNDQAVFYFTKVEDTNTGGNTGGGTGNTGNTGNNTGGGTTNDPNNGGNGSSSNNTPNNNNSNTGSSKNANNSTSTTEGLPQTGESTNPWLAASGVITMASTALAWLFKRKHG